MQTRCGLWKTENLEFEPLLEGCIYEFALVWAPLELAGATGSPGDPGAVR